MALDSLAAPEIKLNLQGEDWKVQFKLRNFAALKAVCKMTENELLQGLIHGDIGKIPYGIWTSTLVFAPFDAADPLKIEKQLDLEQLFNLTLIEMKEVNDKIVQAMGAYLPKSSLPEHAKKRQAREREKTEK